MESYAGSQGSNSAINGDKLIPGGPVPRWSKDRLSRVEDLELALDAAVHVNKHLNVEIEAVLQALRRVERERCAWQAHARRLAQQLAAHKRGACAPLAGDATQEQQQQQQHIADMLAQLPPQPDDADDAGKQQQLLQLQQLAAAVQWEALRAPVEALLRKGASAGWLATEGELQLGDAIGSGAFGTTYCAGWRGAQVAAKSVAVGSETELLNFLREVECLAALRHPNVVPFLGAVLQDQGRCWLISEYMPHGTLAGWLHNDKGPLGPGKPLHARAEKALQVCRALAALESCSPPLLHRDVKPSNVFIDGAGAARLGDFGLARPLPDARASLTGETGTYLYMSPEMIRHEVYDGKTDVWSFGVLLCELLTGQVPYQHTFMTPVQIAMGVADEKLQPQLPAGLPTELLALTAACCDFDPEMRPSFAVLVPELEAAVEALKADAQAAAASGIMGRLMSTSGIPASWASMLGSVGSS